MTTNNYLAQKMSGGKNAFARIMDEVLLDVFAFMLSFSTAWVLKSGFKLATIIALSLSLIFSIIQRRINSEKIERFANEYKKSVKNYSRLEKFTLLSHSEKEALYMEYLGLDSKEFERRFGGLFDKNTNSFYYVFKNHESEAITATDIAEVIIKVRQLGAKNCSVLSAAEYLPEARHLARTHKLKLICGKDLLVLENKLFVSDEEVENMIQAEIENHMEEMSKARKSFLYKGTVFYTAFALVFSIWPAIFGFSLIYPLMSALSIIMAGISYFSTNRHENA